MDACVDRAASVRRLALMCAVLLAAVTGLSAFLRHSAAGLGCQPWPACYGQGERAAAPSVAIGAARLAHRVTATLALLGAGALVVLCLARRPRLRREGALALALLVLALLLALLGVFTPGARVPAVAMANLLGGFAMLALAVRLAAPPAPAAARLGSAALAVAALLLAQIATGALVSAAHAGLACTDLAECSAQARAAGWDWPALAPWREAAFAVGTPHADGALAQWLHRLAGLVVAPAVALLGVAAIRRGRRRAGAAIVLLLGAEIALGLALGSTGLPLVPVLLHNFASAVLLALVLRLA